MTNSPTNSHSSPDNSLDRLLVGKYEERLQKAGAKVEKMACDIFKPVDAIGNSDNESDRSSDSQSDNNTSETSRVRTGSWWNKKKEKERFQRLLKQMNIKERDKLLQSFQSDMCSHAVTSEADLEELNLMEQHDEKIFKQVDGIAQDVLKDVANHEQRTLASMQQFQESIKIMKDTRDAKLKSGLFKHLDIEKMTDEEVAREIECVRAEVLVKERKALQVMNDIIAADGHGEPLDPAEDVLKLQESMLETMRNTASGIEIRAHALTEVSDYLNNRSLVSEDDEMLKLSQEAASVLREFTEDTKRRLMPDLLEQRHAQYGNELVPVDDDYLKKVLKQCEHFASGHVEAETVKQRFMKSGAFDEDIDSKLQAANRLEMPAQVMFDSNLEALSGVFVPTGDDSDDEPEEEADLVKLGYVHAVNEELKMDIRKSKEAQRELLAMLIDAVKEENQMRTEHERCDSYAKALQRTLDMMNDNQMLFTDALALARGLSPVGAISELQRASADPNESPLVAAAVVGAVGSCTNRSSVDMKNEHLWKEAFLADMGDTLDEDTIQHQSEVLEAFADEEVQLSGEIQQLDDALHRRIVHISKLLQESDQEGLSQQLEKSIHETHQTLRDFSQSRQYITHCGSEEVSRLASHKDDTRLTLGGRRKAVKVARTLQGSVFASTSGLPGDRTNVVETLKLQDQNAALVQKIKHLEGELTWRRLRFEGLKEERRRSSVKVPLPQLDAFLPGRAQARELRRQTRDMRVMRAEVRFLNAFIKSNQANRDIEFSAHRESESEQNE